MSKPSFARIERLKTRRKAGFQSSMDAKRKLKRALSAQYEDWERDLAAEIETMPRIRVHDNVNPLMNMVPRECHLNVRFYVANDPHQRARHALCWKITNGLIMLHSIVQVGEDYAEITPDPYNTQSEYVHDPKLVLPEDWDKGITRDGRRMPPMIRSASVVGLTARV